MAHSERSAIATSKNMRSEGEATGTTARARVVAAGTIRERMSGEMACVFRPPACRQPACSCLGSTRVVCVAPLNLVRRRPCVLPRFCRFSFFELIGQDPVTLLCVQMRRELQNHVARKTRKTGHVKNAAKSYHEDEDGYYSDDDIDMGKPPSLPPIVQQGESFIMQ